MKKSQKSKAETAPSTKRGRQGEGGGRPTKKTIEVVGKLREVFLIDYNVLEACDHAGIHPDTYYEWIKKDKKFSDEMQEAQRGLFKSAKRVIASEIIVKENPTIALQILKHRQPDRYKTKTEFDPVNPSGGLPAGTVVVLPGSYPHPRIIPEPTDAED